MTMRRVDDSVCPPRWLSHRGGGAGNALSLLFLMLLCVAAPWGSEGYVEEACFIDGQVLNLYATAVSLGCDYGEYVPKCIYAALLDGSATFGETSPCRGFVHFDSVFFTAQALGFTGEVAYWISAFAQSVDFVQFMPVDSCGRVLEERLWTPPMRGFLRTSTLTGQHLRHLGLVTVLGSSTRPSDITGLAPNVTDYEFEGMLATARAWAFGETDLYCTLGITEPVDGNYFKGDRCLNTTFVDNLTPQQVKGPIPAPSINTTLGDQVMHYNCDGDPLCENPPYNLTDVMYAYQLAEYLGSSTWSKLQDGSPVPEVIARFGVYLHQLADRNSHFYCTDSTDTAVLGPRLSDGAFYLTWNVTSCNWMFHGTQHYWEQGVEGNPPLAPQTWATLSSLYDEVEAFADRFRSTHPTWFSTNAERLSKAVVVGEPNQPGILPSLATLVDVVERVNLFRQALNDHGYEQVPGHEAECSCYNGSCSSAGRLESFLSAFV